MNSTWPILIVLLAIAMALGPVLMMRPTPGQRRLAAIRNEAIKRGLHVRLNQALAQHADYVLPFPQKPARTPQTWALRKAKFEHALNFAGDWEWEGQPLPDEQLGALKELIAKAPPGLGGLGVNPAEVYASWDEKLHQASLTAALDELSTFLGRLSDWATQHSS